jgi:hypothetical protein
MKVNARIFGQSNAREGAVRWRYRRLNVDAAGTRVIIQAARGRPFAIGPDPA